MNKHKKYYNPASEIEEKGAKLDFEDYSALKKSISNSEILMALYEQKFEEHGLPKLVAAHVYSHERFDEIEKRFKNQIVNYYKIKIEELSEDGFTG